MLNPGESSARKKFNVSDDLILLRAMSVVKPWEAAVGTMNDIMKSFNEMAKLCYMNGGFIADKQGPALRTRFSHLLCQHQKQQLLSMRSSGTTEEHGEREFLLVDITTRMNDAKELQDTKKTREAKAKGDRSLG
ncbi:hypothetical protein PF005_g6070 [Phytophthora fragariae]|uniref:Uncharacterized protein n=1 Tax=Phytophthora fragariae TaxID=53985 RepID=A0A6A3YS39_9STRA|nr:hypothetical protein PF005_g6070 [Phytophthora fragariae]KAE9357118.1 hypothetical protein PF008_g3316 [Phytophthora fragariae]